MGKESTAAMIDSECEMLFFQRTGELSGIWRLDFADSPAEEKSFSFGNCITWENEIVPNTSWKVKNRQQSSERENSENCNSKKRHPIYVLLWFKYQNTLKILMKSTAEIYFSQYQGKTALGNKHVRAKEEICRRAVFFPCPENAS